MIPIKLRSYTIHPYLDNHVIEDEEEVDSFRGHDKDVKATGGLVQAHTLELTAELESSLW